MTDTDARRDGTADASNPGPDDAADRIWERAESIRREECEVALRRLGEEGGLSASQRRAVERMTERITASLIATPTAALRAADDGDETATALELFGGDGRGGTDDE